LRENPPFSIASGHLPEMPRNMHANMCRNMPGSRQPRSPPTSAGSKTMSPRAKTIPIPAAGPVDPAELADWAERRIWATQTWLADHGPSNKRPWPEHIIEQKQRNLTMYRAVIAFARAQA
jgi:hypothetical protein